jgi:hypothetical protein
MRNPIRSFLSIFLAIFISLFAFIGCAADKKSEVVKESFQYESPAEDYAINDGEQNSRVMEDSKVKENKVEENKLINSSSKKIIRNVDITLQTTEFGKSIEEINKSIDEFKGFIQSSYMNGNGIDNKGNTYNRNGNITARIPSKDLEGYLIKLRSIAHVTQEGQQGEDVTLTYVDNETRLKILKVKEERLLEILKESKNVTDIIAVESELSKVRYDIESVEGYLKNLNNLIEYSTVYINIEEVEQIKNEIDVKGSIFEKMTNSFINSIKDVGYLMKNSIIYIAASIPYIVVIGLIVFLFRFIIKRFNIKDKFIKTFSKK